VVLVRPFRLWRSKSLLLLMYNSESQVTGWIHRIHYVSTLTVTSSWYVMRMVQHFFSLYIKYKLWYWTLSMLTEKGILTRSINLPFGSKYTMWLDVSGCITRIARRFMWKSVP
jgi:hypothetical protein